MDRASPAEARLPAAALGLLCLTPALFASNMLVARWSQGSIPPVALAFWRWSLTLLLLLPFTLPRLWLWRRELWAEWPLVLLLGALGMGMCGAPVYLAAATTEATNMGLIYAASPILILIMGRIGWGERVTARQFLGIPLCLAGVLAILSRGRPTALWQIGFSRGDLLVMAAAASWALYSVLLKHRPSPVPLFTRFTAICCGGLVAMAPFYALEIAAGQCMEVDGRSLATIVFLALAPSLGAYLTYGRLVALVGAARTGLVMYLVPLYTAGFAVLLLGERLALFHLAGLALILPGVYLATRPASARKR